MNLCFSCEKCDLLECNCFCKCGLPHNECVCDMTEEDWEAWDTQLKNLKSKENN